MYPYQGRNLRTGLYEYTANSFMRFIPTDNSMSDISHGENECY